jgi:hypothetical protein
MARRDDETPPESHSLRRFLLHVVDEMPWRVVAAFVFVAFFFFYGFANSVIKLLGREVASFDFPVGPTVGAVAGLTTLVACLRIKCRRR